MFKKENEMAPFVSSFLREKNLRVRSEVLSYDIMGDNGNHVFIVEMKMAFNVKVISQACDAQKSAHYVYIAIPDFELFKIKSKQKIPKDFRSRMEDNVAICKRLGIGLILVGENSVRVINEANLSSCVVGHRINSVRKEANGRPEDENIAGSTGVKQMTSYKYRAIAVARALYESIGPMSPADISKLTGDADTYGILYKNHFKWFLKHSRGKYIISDTGAEYLRTLEYRNN